MIIAFMVVEAAIFSKVIFFSTRKEIAEKEPCLHNFFDVNCLKLLWYNLILPFLIQRMFQINLPCINGFKKTLASKLNT